MRYDDVMKVGKIMGKIRNNSKKIERGQPFSRVPRRADAANLFSEIRRNPSCHNKKLPAMAGSFLLWATPVLLAAPQVS